MKIRAAVALEKAKPLQIAEVDLDGPKAGEVMVEVKATGICHTDEFTLSGADPGRDAAADVTNLIEGRVLADLRNRDLRQHCVLGEGGTAHIVMDFLAAD